VENPIHELIARLIFRNASAAGKTLDLVRLRMGDAIRHAAHHIDLKLGQLLLFLVQVDRASLLNLKTSDDFFTNRAQQDRF